MSKPTSLDAARERKKRADYAKLVLSAYDDPSRDQLKQGVAED